MMLLVYAALDALHLAQLRIASLEQQNQELREELRRYLASQMWELYR
jgi:hypothetical protein